MKYELGKIKYVEGAGPDNLEAINSSLRKLEYTYLGEIDFDDSPKYDPNTKEQYRDSIENYNVTLEGKDGKLYSYFGTAYKKGNHHIAGGEIERLDEFEEHGLT
jgi:hypothetical protein